MEILHIRLYIVWIVGNYDFKCVNTAMTGIQTMVETWLRDI